MSNDKNNEFHGEILTPEIVRKGIYELGKVNRVPPAVGIFDSPTRCFVVNQEWWSHIAGMVHLLADVVSWRDAEDEDYFAIREILKFMQGMECMDFALRQNPADECVLQQTLDGGTTWTDVFDFSLCATIQDKSYQVQIQNQVTYVQPTFQEIYNYYTNNYTGSPDSVHPNLADPAGNSAALRAAYCNALFELVKTACNVAVSYYTETVNQQQNEINVGLGIAAFLLAAISLAAAIPSAGASLVGLAPAAAIWATGISLGGVLGNALVDFWQQHTIDQFQDTSAIEDVACYLFEEVPAEDNSLATMQAALASHPLTGNAGVIADFLSILMEHDSTYAAFLEKWSNNKEFADAGIELYCPCMEGFIHWIWDFENDGKGQWDNDPTVAPEVQGTFAAGVGWQGTDSGGNRIFNIVHPLESTYEIRGGSMWLEVDGALINRQMRFRPTANSTAGQVTVNLANHPACNNFANNALPTTYRQINVRAWTDDIVGHQVTLKKVILVFNANAALIDENSIVSDVQDSCP